jgi:intein-encoded DNA endonuclease-like protein
MVNGKWKIWEVDYLKENYGKRLVEKIARHLNRTPSYVRAKANNLNLKSNIPYSRETHRKIALKLTKLLKKNINISSKELAYIIGVLNGDGCLQSRRFCLITIDYDFLKKVKENIEKLSGIKTKEYKYFNTKYNSYKQGFHYELNLNSVKFVGFLKKYYLAKNEKAIKNIKKLIQNNKVYEIEFIKGFFDSEGCIRKNGRISIDNSKKEWVVYISVLLTKLKINHKIYFWKNKENSKNYRLNIQTKEDIRKFCNLIHSSIKRKQDRIEKFKT